MAKSETGIQNESRVALSEAGCLNWRQNVGVSMGADGKPRKHGFAGWSDLGGIYRGIGLQLEVKDGNGRVTAQQINWLNAVRKAGGVGAIIRCPEDAIAVLRKIDKALGDNWFLDTSDF